MREMTWAVVTAIGITSAALIIVIGISSCERTYQRAFEAGYTTCMIPGSNQSHWCKDGKEVQP